MLFVARNLSRLSHGLRGGIVVSNNSCLTSSKRAAVFFTTDSITYSGGQATGGQGGYYGSGGARKLDLNKTTTEPITNQNDPRPQMLALAADVTNITNTMKEVETLEQLLIEIVQDTSDESNGGISGKTIEIRSKIKKACTNPEFMESLNRLELNGEPIWGLSGDEREMIMSARSKVNEC